MVKLYVYFIVINKSILIMNCLLMMNVCWNIIKMKLDTKKNPAYLIRI